MPRNALHPLLVAILLVTALCPLVQSQEPEPEKVPMPFVHEAHDFNVNTFKERWGLNINYGDVVTGIGVATVQQLDGTFIMYQVNNQYMVKGHLYTGQFTIEQIVFKIDGNEIRTKLIDCKDYNLTHTEPTYVNTTPVLDASIKFDDINVYPGTSKVSSYDLTLIHHFVADWYNSSVKIEALFDLNSTAFYDANGTEYSKGERFTAEIIYTMSLMNISAQSPITPTGYTNTTLDYDVIADNGVHLTVSKLNMKNDFTIYNGTGSERSVGYSYMDFHGNMAEVMHGFPNLTYKDTMSMRSDPKLTVFHDKAKKFHRGSLLDERTKNILKVWVPVLIIVTVVVIAVYFIRKKRRKAKPKKKGD